MKAATAVAIVTLGIGLSPAVFAQTANAPDAGTQPALQCLLHSGPKQCEKVFVASASPKAVRWVRLNPWPTFALGPVESSNFARTISGADACDTKFLNGRVTDVYDVKFMHQEMTFYIERPEADGKIRYMLVRDGSPDDERRDLFLHGPG